MGFLVGRYLSCLPQPFCSLSPPLPCLEGMGTTFPLGAAVLLASHILCFTSEKLGGSVFAGAGTPPVLLPSRLAPLHPVDDKLSRHEALQAHGGAQVTYFQRWLAASSHLVGSSCPQTPMSGLLRSCFLKLEALSCLHCKAHLSLQLSLLSPLSRTSLQS